MSFKFADIEGIDPELAARLDGDEKITGAVSAYIDEAATNRENVAKQSFKAKMDGLNAKLEAANGQLEAFGGVTPDEIKSLKAASGKAPELEATLAEKDKRIAELEKADKDKDARLQNMLRSNTIAAAINEYDTAHPTVSVKPDMKDVVSMLAQDALRFDEATGQFRVYNKQGEIVATDKGAASPVDWLLMLRDERPSLFNVPTGGGASGSTSSGSAKKYADMTEQERVALYRENPTEFQKLKGAQ